MWTVYKYAHMRGYAKYVFQGGEETRGFGSISVDIKVKRSETPLAGITFRRLHLRPKRSLRGVKLKERSKNAILPQPLLPVFSPLTLRSRSQCLSLWFTFSRHDGDGDVRFNKAPGMSRHVMHSIVCEIYVNTAIRPVESAISLSHFLSFPSTTRIPWHPLTYSR